MSARHSAVSEDEPQAGESSSTASITERFRWLSDDERRCLEIAALLPSKHVVKAWLGRIFVMGHRGQDDGAELINEAGLQRALDRQEQDHKMQLLGVTGEARLTRALERLMQDHKMLLPSSMDGVFEMDPEIRSALVDGMEDLALRKLRVGNWIVNRAAALLAAPHDGSSRVELNALLACREMFEQWEHGADLIYLEIRLAHLLRLFGEYTQAVELLRPLVESRVRANLLDASAASRMSLLGLLYLDLERNQEASDILTQSIAILEAEGREKEDLDELGLAVILYNLASAHHGLGELAEAETQVRRAIAFNAAHECPDANCLSLLAFILEDLGKLAEARGAWTEAIEVERDTLGSRHSEVALSLAALAKLEYELDDGERALELASEAESILLEHFDASHPDVHAVRAYLNEFLKADSAKTPS